MIPDFSAQFRPRYVWNNDTMLRAWWWAMYWPWTATSGWMMCPLAISIPPVRELTSLFDH